MVVMTLNGVPTSVSADPDTPLLWVLRSELRMTGTKYGCGQGLCGACTVHLDGVSVRSCQISMESVAGRAITTIEGLKGPEADALRQAWDEIDVVQCGYCQSGQLMSAHALLKENVRPSRDEIDITMDGNICRCGTYPRIRAAIETAVRILAGRASSSEGIPKSL